MSDMVLVAPTLLSEAERELFNQSEAKIANGLMMMGEGLRTIRDHQLWRDEWVSFDNYCTQKWGFGVSRANQIISATNTVAMIKTATGIELTNERQARALNGIDAELKNVVVKTAHAFASANNVPITEGLLKRTAEVYREATSTGYVDTGTGYSNPVIAALTIAESEAIERHAKHVSESRKPNQPITLHSSLEVVTIVETQLYRGDPTRSAKAIVQALGSSEAYEVMIKLAEILGQ